MLNRALGLTLIEVMLATALVGLLSSAVLSWHLEFQHSLHHQQQQREAEQALHHWLHWLWRDLQNTLVVAPQAWSFDFSRQCLLYGDVGVRVQSNNLQWRPQQSSCNSAGWQALNSPQRIKFTQLNVSAQQLCLSARHHQQSMEACLPWPI